MMTWDDYPLATPWMTKQPSLGTALPTLDEGSYKKGGINKVLLLYPQLANHSQLFFFLMQSSLKEEKVHKCVWKE